MQAMSVVTSLRAYILFLVVSLQVPDPSDESSEETCQAIITVGMFHTAEAAVDWERKFKLAASDAQVQVLDSWTAKKMLPFKRVVDFDPNIEGGTPPEVVSYLHEHVPDKERIEIGGWLALARSK